MKRLVALGVAALVIASCGGNEKSAATVPAAVTTSVADATAPTATSAPVPTSTTAVAETTTLPATTTTVATEDQIKQAVQDYGVAYHLCGVTPATCVPESFTAEEGHSRSTLLELATGMSQQGLHFAADARGSYLVAESVTMVSVTEATATFCAYDAGTVLGPNGPDGLATVVNDQVVSIRNEYRLYLEATDWRVGEQQQIEELGPGSLCPPAG